MKVVYIFAMVAACYGAVVKREVTDLQPPNVQVEIIDGALKVSWDEVKNEDAHDPIIGYRLKIWGLRALKATITSYSLVNYTGKHTINVEQIPPINPNRTPKGKLTEILTSATKTTATTKPLKPGVTYEFRVQAFTKTREGKMSFPIRVKINEEEDSY